MQRLVLLAAAAVFSLSGAIAFAQGTGKTAKTPSGPRTAASIECSKQADAKGLHGKQRRTFRSKCKREMEALATSRCRRAALCRRAASRHRRAEPGPVAPGQERRS